MYKIYINRSLLILCSLDVFQEIGKSGISLSFLYTGNKKRLHNVIDLLEKSEKKQRVVIYSTDTKGLWDDFKSIHLYKTAAGGIVFNEDGELLVIFRRGKWDLPKGHIEPNEKTKQTAVREVEEECGINGLQLNKKIGKTYHFYRIKGNKVLKKSIWYHMNTHNQVTIPQKKEKIEQALWINPQKFMEEYDMHGNIMDILTKFFKIVASKNK
jgi:8-oxo-dGTP pyrophosphatase MutT (NUDIX family)